ncbi:MAG: beta-ketoacyl-ACP synthase III [Pseudomonadota bacterium]|nr:beta-ketoacyl-ACP synthase III [Pseudomonadota bacterium]
MTFARIAGVGGYLPERILTNAEISKSIETSDEWIRTRSGIRERRIAADTEFTCDLAEKAASRALQSAGRDPEEIDLVVVATTTPDQVFPSTACLLQARLNIGDCPAFDIQAVCAGFVYALDIVNKYIACDAARCALIVGAETFSRILDWTDRSTCVLFGDGAGAMIIEAAAEPGIRSTHLHADGAYTGLLQVPVGVSTAHSTLAQGRAYTEMHGAEVFRWAVKAMGDVVEEALRHNQIDQSEVDWLVPHQANLRIISATAKRAGFDMERVVVTVDRHGNTSAASIPLAFDEAVRDGRIKRGHNVLLEGFGGGFTWGSVLLRY